MNNELKILEQQNRPICYISEKKKKMSIFQGYKYYSKYVGVKHTFMSCNGSYRINEDESISNIKDHNHEPMTSSDIRILLFKEDIIRDSTSTRKTKNDIICSASSTLDESERQRLPSLENMKRNIRKLQADIKNYSYSTNYDIPDELLTSRSGYKFVNFDNYFLNEPRIVGLWTDNNVKEASMNKVFALDGTFYTCPKGFYQLMIFFSVKNYKHTPFAYFLVPDKTQKTYELIYDILIKSSQLKQMENIIVDFELALEKSLCAKFKNINIRFCLFHYSQTIYRKLRSLGLDMLYRRNIDFRFLIKCLLCFVFVKENDRKATFKLISTEILDRYRDKNVVELMNYYYNNWYKSRAFRNDDLYQRIIFDIPFTNNGAEGLNSALKKEVKMVHPSLTEILIVLRNRDFLSELNKYDIKNSYQASKYIIRNQKLIKTLREFDKENKMLKLKELTAIYSFKDDIINKSN